MPAAAMPRGDESLDVLDPLPIDPLVPLVPLDPVPIDPAREPLIEPVEPAPIEPAEPAPIEPVDGELFIEPVPVEAPPIVEPGEAAPLDPLVASDVPPMLPPIEVPPAPPDRTEALGFIACASRLHASKSDCEGSAARAGAHTPTIPATTNTAVAPYSLFMMQVPSSSHVAPCVRAGSM